LKKLLYIARYQAFAALLLMLSALAPAIAQNVVYQGETTTLAVDSIYGDSYSWELYNDSTVNFATVPGACPTSNAEFVGGDNIGPSVQVEWKLPGTYFFKVTAWDVSGCTQNIKIGIMEVLEAKPTATISSPDPMLICAGETASLEVTLTGKAPWDITYTDGANSWTEKGITDSVYQLKISPNVSTVYWITEVKNARGTNLQDSESVLVVVSPKPEIGRIYVFPLQAAGEEYVIDRVCIGAVRNYRVEGEQGSVYTWLLTNSSDVKIPLPNSAGKNFTETGSNGIANYGNEITLQWNNIGYFKLEVIQTSVFNCDTIEQGYVEVFNPPTAIAGNPLSICSGIKVDLLNAQVTNHDSLLWTTSGDGFFDDPHALITSYAGGINDLINGRVHLTITAYGKGKGTSCTPASSTRVATFKANPKLVLNDPPSVCFPQTIDLSAASITLGSDPDLVFKYFRDEYGTYPLTNYKTVGSSGVYYIEATDSASECSVLGKVNVVFDQQFVPSFASIPDLCVNSEPPILQSADFRGISGTWSPAVISTAMPGITDYTFTPNAGQCAQKITIKVEVSNAIQPRFSFNTSFCQGSVVALPTMSANGIAGTWSPSTVFTGSVGKFPYTFTPDAGGCGVPVDIDITITPAVSPNFSFNTNVCVNSTPPALPSVSNEGFTGTWIPATIDNNVSGFYTFTPSSGQCAKDATIRISINLKEVPQFDAIDPLCFNSFKELPAVSKNGISGKWLPSSVINTSQAGDFTYRFVPDAAFCADDYIMPVTIYTPVKVVIKADPITVFGGTTNAIVTASGGSGTGYTGTGTFVSTSGTYTFSVTDDAGCTGSGTIYIGEPQDFTVSFTKKDILCIGGRAEVTITAIGGTGPYTYSYTGGDPDYRVDLVNPNVYQLNASAIPYVFKVIDTNGLHGGGDITIDNPVGMSLAATFTAPTCYGGNNGTATVTTTNALGIPTYLWNDPLKQTTAKATNLLAGTYIVQVTDGCGTKPLTVIVPEPPVISMTAIGKESLCNGTPGNIQFNFTNIPDGLYDILYDGGKFTAVNISGNTASVTAAAGNYNNLKLILNGCSTADGIVATVKPTTVLTINKFFVQQPTCKSPRGTILVQEPVQNSGFLYSKDNGLNYQPSSAFVALTPATYQIKIKEVSTGCESAPISVAINPPPAGPAAPDASVTQQPDCSTATGTITVTAPVPAAGITYTVTGTNPVKAPVTNNTGIFTGLTAGVYDVITTDASGCASSATVKTIDVQPVTPAAPIVSVTNPNCTVATGTITATAPVPGPGITYTVKGTNPVLPEVINATGVFPGLTPGDYEITTTNTDGCTSAATSKTILPNLPIPGAPIAGTPIQPNCTTVSGSVSLSGLPSGTWMITSEAGTITGTGTSMSVTGLLAGKYHFTVTNAAGCTSVITEVVINNQPSTPADLVSIPILPECEKSPIQTLNANNGIVPPPAGTLIRWYDGSGNLIISPILNKPGTVTYLAEAFNGNCASKNRTPVTLTIYPAPVVLVSQNPYEVCVQSPVQTIDARTVVSVQSGVTLKWYDTAVGGTEVSLPVWNKVGTKIYYTETFSGQCPSPARTKITLTIYPLPDTPELTILTPPNCKNEGGSIEITKPTGPGFEYSIDGGTYQTSPIFANLSSKKYSFKTRNAVTKCESVDETLILPDPPLPPVMKKVTVENCICYGDSGSINFEFENVKDGTYVIVYLTGKFQNVKVVDNKARIMAVAGKYDILAIEANGCTSTQKWDVEINQPDRIVASYEITGIDLKSDQKGEIDLTISGGTGKYQTIWEPNTSIQFAGSVDEDIANLRDGDYLVTITDENGCPQQLKITIPIANLPPIATNDKFIAICGRISGNLLFKDNGSGIDKDPDGDEIILDPKPIGFPVPGLTLNPDGSFEYQAAPGFSGDVIFGYIIFDEKNNPSIPATVTITVIADFDGDGIADADDPDADGDGILNIYEALPGQDWRTADADGDGSPNYLDIDSDGDGIPDNIEAQGWTNYIPPSNLDVNNNGVDDAYDKFQFAPEIVPIDTDGDGIPDFLDSDSDNDGVLDYIEGHDLNADGKPDRFAFGSDSDGDGLDDAYDDVVNGCNALGNAVGTYADPQDFDGDGIPDWRDDDDDNDGYLTKFEDLNGDGDWSNDDLDYDGHPEYLDYGRDCDLFIPDAFSPNGDNIHDYFQIYCINHFPDAKMYIFDQLGNKLFEKAHYGNLDYWLSYDRAWWNGKPEFGPSKARNEIVPPGTYYYVLDLGNGEVKKSYVFISY